MPAIENLFSWSKSRHGKFDECRRGYWFTYYGSWGGWDQGAPPEVRERYVLKTLSTRQQWAGKLVHDAIQGTINAIQAGRSVDRAAAEESLHRLMRLQFSESRRGFYRTLSPRRHPGLVEHELGLDVSPEEWRRNWENARASFMRFFQMGWDRKAADIPADRRLPVDVLDSFVLEGVRVFAAPDFALWEDDGLVIVDWKTGTYREADEKQVQGYVLFAESKWGVPRERITARLVYLGSGETRDVRVDEEALDEFMGHFRFSVADMRSCLADPERNIPLPMESFPMCGDAGRCEGCQFRRLCFGK